MQLGRGVVYALVSSLLLFSVVVAVHQNARSWRPPSEPEEAGGAAFGAAWSAAGSKGRIVPRPRSVPASQGGFWPFSFEPATSAEGEDEPAAPASRPGVRGPATAGTSSRGAVATLLARASEGSSGSSASDQGSLGGSTGGDDGGSSQGGDQPTVKAITFGESQQTACVSGQKDFFLESLRDLHVCVAWRGLSGTYVERLTFRTPNGNVYQVLTVPFVTPGSSAPTGGVEVEGRSLDVIQAGTGAQGETLVVAQLPVAGTFITQHNLVGLWTVEVSLAGQVVQNTFVLNRAS